MTIVAISTAEPSSMPVKMETTAHSSPPTTCFGDCRPDIAFAPKTADPGGPGRVSRFPLLLPQRRSDLVLAGRPSASLPGQTSCHLPSAPKGALYGRVLRSRVGTGWDGLRATGRLDPEPWAALPVSRS